MDLVIVALLTGIWVALLAILAVARRILERSEAIHRSLLSEIDLGMPNALEQLRREADLP